MDHEQIEAQRAYDIFNADIRGNIQKATVDGHVNPEMLIAALVLKSATLRGAVRVVEYLGSEGVV